MATNPVAQAATTNVIKAIETVAARPDNPMSEVAVAKAKPDLRAEIREAIEQTPEVQFATNTEPFWRSHAFWITVSAIVAGVSTVADKLGEAMQSGSKLTWFTLIPIAIAGGLAVKARLTTVPLGTAPTRRSGGPQDPAYREHKN